MSTVIDEILNELDSVSDTTDTATEQKVEADAVVETPTLERASGTDTVAGQWEDIPFSELFWPPVTVPDHLCRVYKELEHPSHPDFYVPPKEEVELVSLAFATGNKLLNVGPTGCGKTLMFEYMAHKLGRPYLRIEHNEAFSYEMVFGQTHINHIEGGGTETDFIEGVLPRSMELPTIVNLDETSRNSGHQNILYQRLLDRRELSLNEVKGGKGVKVAHPDWIVCGSDNTKGNGDDMDKYSASNVQDQAFINRFDMVLESDYLSQEQEAEMIKRLAPKMDEAVVNSLAKFSGLMHNGYKSGEITTAFSPRNLVAIARLYNTGLTLRKAVEVNFMSRCTRSELSDVHESFRSVFG